MTGPLSDATKKVMKSHDAYSRGEWMNPLNRIEWQKAVRAKKDTVTVKMKMPGDKKPHEYEFTIEYNNQQFIWVHPKDSRYLAPCGWFSVDKILDSQWVSNG